MAPSHGMSLAHLLWFQRHRGDVWRSVRQIRFAKDYVPTRLTGCRATDPTTPSRSSLLDIRRGQWSQEVCGAFGIDAGLLPRIGAPPWAPVAELPAARTADLGLRPGLPVAMGGSDDASAALGCGAIEPGLAHGPGGVPPGSLGPWRRVAARGSGPVCLRGGDREHRLVAALAARRAGR